MDRKIKILAVDDEVFNLEIITHTLQKRGYEVTCVDNGGKALVLLHTSPQDFDLVLLDRMMPIMNGMEVLQQVKENPKLRHLPVIMQTAASGREQISEGIKAGAYYYLTKPYDSKSLVKVVENAIQDIFKSEKKREEARKSGVIEATEECYFDIKTLEEAELTALYLSNLYPDPDDVIFSMQRLLFNAVIYGNLGMSKGEKERLEEDGRLEAKVTDMLRLSKYQDKKVEVTYRLIKEEGIIELLIHDDGNGFDWEKYIKQHTLNAEGEKLVAGLRGFDEVEYHGAGNEVQAITRINIPEDENASQKESSNKIIGVKESW